MAGLWIRIRRIFQERPETGPARQLYLAAVAQARQPDFYTRYAVPDTLDGRFDMTALHVFLILYRLRSEGEAMRDLGQAVFDYMFGDMDRSLRELGVGDLRVGKRIQPMEQAFMGRVQTYRDTLMAGDIAGLTEALHRNVYRGEAGAPAPALAQYVETQVTRLATQPAAALQQGQIAFGNP